MTETSVHQNQPVALPVRPFGRVVRSVIGYAFLVALMTVFAMPVFVPAALFICAMRNGRRGGWAALAIAATVAVVTVAATPGTPELMRFATSYIVGVILALGVPSLLAMPLVERGEPFGRTLLFLLGGALVGLLLTEVGVRAVSSFSPYDVHAAQSAKAADQLVKGYRTGGMPADAVAFMERWGKYYSTVLLPAGTMLSATLAFTLSLLMIGRLHAWREPVAQRGEGAVGAYLFRNFTLPDWLLFGFVFGGLTPIAHGLIQQVAANVLTVVVFLYIVQGFALFRYLLAAVGVGFIGALAGAMLVVFSGVGPILLGVAGLFDPFFNFRHKKKRKDDSHESHSD